MNRIFLLFFIFLPVFLNSSVIEITASRLSNFPGLEVISKDEIENSRANDLEDILSLSDYIDIQKREPFSVQQDVTINGSTFEEVLVLIDGVRVNNIQTNHHQLNIPLSKDDIERIEVLPVPSSSFYGNGAYAGVINIITKKRKKHHLRINSSFYEKRTFAYDVSYGLTKKNYSWYFGESNRRSPGYFPERDFLVKNYFGKFDYNGKYNLSLNIGWQKKDFGAKDFYATTLDNEREKIDTNFYSLVINLPLEKNFFLKTNSYYQKSEDNFSYLSDTTSVSNTHNTSRTGLEVSFGYLKKNFGIILGGEFYVDEIESNVLDDEKNKNKSLFLGMNYSKRIYDLSLNLRRDKSSKFLTNNSFSISFAFDTFLKPSLTLSSSYRTPSYTELKYWDPGNVGNKMLNIERSFYYGMNFDFNYFNLNVFLREGKDLIDWIKFTSTDTYHAYGVPEFDLYGFTISKKLKNFKFAYSFLKDRKTSFDFYSSKYLMRYPQHKINFYFYKDLKILSLSMDGFFKKRKEEEGYFVLSLKASKKIYKDLEIYLEGKNILDEKYEEIKDVKQPGRWLGIGINLKI